MLKHQNSRDCIYCIWFIFSFQITQAQGFSPTMLHEMDVFYQRLRGLDMHNSSLSEVNIGFRSWGSESLTILSTESKVWMNYSPWIGLLGMLATSLFHRSKQTACRNRPLKTFSLRCFGSPHLPWMQLHGRKRQRSIVGMHCSTQKKEEFRKPWKPLLFS